jgi:hypothetical protein
MAAGAMRGWLASLVAFVVRCGMEWCPAGRMRPALEIYWRGWAPWRDLITGAQAAFLCPAGRNCRGSGGSDWPYVLGVQSAFPSAMLRLPVTHRRREDEHGLLSLSAFQLRERDGVTGMFARGLKQTHGGVQEASKYETAAAMS